MNIEEADFDGIGDLAGLASIIGPMTVEESVGLSMVAEDAEIIFDNLLNIDPKGHRIVTYVIAGPPLKQKEISPSPQGVQQTLVASLNMNTKPQKDMCSPSVTHQKTLSPHSRRVFSGSLVLLCAHSNQTGNIPYRVCHTKR